MFTRILKNFLILNLSIILPSLCFAEKIYLKDGTIIFGKILEQNKNEIVIETKFGVLKVKKDLVLKIIYTDPKISKFKFGQKEQSLGVLLGLKYPSNSGFQDQYGIRLAYGGLFSFFVGNKTELEIMATYSSKKPKILKNTKFTSIPVLVRIKRILWQRGQIIPYLGLGVAYYFSKIKASQPFLENLGQPEDQKFSQTERGFGINFGIGTYIFLQTFTLFLEIEYAYTFLGNPHIGRFGNIGGFNFNFGTKINL